MGDAVTNLVPCRHAKAIKSFSLHYRVLPVYFHAKTPHQGAFLLRLAQVSQIGKPDHMYVDVAWLSLVFSCA